MNHMPIIIRSSEELKAILSPTSSIFVGAFCNEPQNLMEMFKEVASDLSDYELYTLITGSSVPYINDLPSNIKVKTFLSCAKFTGLEKTNQLEYIPLNISEISDFIESGSVDVAVIQLSDKDEDGNYNLGISVDILPSLIACAKIVIAEINLYLPKSNGMTKVHESQINYLLMGNKRPITIEVKEGSEVEKAIARNVASLIPDGATIQIGIGSLANEIAKGLCNKKDLGVHSGSFNNGMKFLQEIGVITNRFKEIDTGVSVATTIIGDERLYDFVNNNHQIRLMPANYTHDPLVIAKISNFYAINSALEVDITGQINAESLNSSIIAGVGGQMDFILGARLSNNGKSIIALPSSIRNGEISKIKKTIEAVSSLKSEIDYIVTEYGVAYLKGKSLQQRKEELAKIAHPNFRVELFNEV